MHDEIIEHGMSYCTPVPTSLASFAFKRVIRDRTHCGGQTAARR